MGNTSMKILWSFFKAPGHMEIIIAGESEIKPLDSPAASVQVAGRLQYKTIVFETIRDCFQGDHCVIGLWDCFWRVYINIYI